MNKLINISDNLFNRLVNMDLENFDKTLDNINNFKYRKIEEINNNEMAKFDINMNVNNDTNITKKMIVFRHYVKPKSKLCKTNNCCNKVYKDKICINHYKKIKDNICVIHKCNNIRFVRYKNKYTCFKHYKLTVKYNIKSSI